MIIYRGERRKREILSQVRRRSADVTWDGRDERRVPIGTKCRIIDGYESFSAGAPRPTMRRRPPDVFEPDCHFLVQPVGGHDRIAENLNAPIQECCDAVRDVSDSFIRIDRLASPKAGRKRSRRDRAVRRPHAH